jgi:nicotinamidase-related amidase
VRRAVEKAREGGVPVVWVQHQSAELVPGSADWQWVPELCLAEGEPVIPKRFNSAFEDTTLDAVLAGLGATHLVLAGCATNWCIRATAYGALDRGYDLTLVEDAHTTGTIELGDGRRIDAMQIIDDLNITMAWLAYPGRSNRAVAVDALDFAALGTAG